MAIIAISLTLAAPSFSEFLANQNSKRTAKDLYAFLVLTRSEAINRNATITLKYPTGGSWTGSWVIVDATTTLHDHPAVSGQALTITGPTSVQFGRSGRILNTTVPTFDISPTQYSSGKHWCVQTDLTGRPNIQEKEGSC